MIIMRTGFDGIPESLKESAVIDGAGHLTVLCRIMLPLALPTLAVILLYYGVGHWNAWFNASVFLNDDAKYPLQLILRGILLLNDTTNMTGTTDTETWAAGESIKYAVIVIATLPILCLYPFLQKYFVKGVMIGAVKG
ncbi:MAG: ABC transporter permease subunit, partial [Clostridiales bacterium]|jgi:putative aldouronate transport system permease protein|nr:ABC transporter permease subunit [Clostridiales bacterium]